MDPNIELIDVLTRKLAKRARVDGVLGWQTDGDPDLIKAFLILGWDDPHVEPEPEPEPEPAPPEPTPLPSE